MNAPANIEKTARRAAWESYAAALEQHRPCKSPEERRVRCRLLELRDLASRLKHGSTQPVWQLLGPLEELAGWYAFADDPIETLDACRVGLQSLWIAASQLHLAFPPELMPAAHDGR